MRKFALILLALVIALLIAAIWNEHIRFASFQAENHQRIAKVEEDVRALHSDLEALSKSPKTAASKDVSDLPGIRGAIAELRRRAEDLEKKPLATAANTNTPPKEAESYVYPDSTLRKNYTFAGFTSPATATESVLFSISKLDRKSFETTVTDDMAKVWQTAFEDLPPDVMPGGFKNGSMYRATGFKVLEETPVSDTEMKLKIFLEGQNQILKMVFKKVGNDWKWSANF